MTRTLNKNAQREVGTEAGGTSVWCRRREVKRNTELSIISLEESAEAFKARILHVQKEQRRMNNECPPIRRMKQSRSFK